MGEESESVISTEAQQIRTPKKIIIILSDFTFDKIQLCVERHIEIYLTTVTQSKHKIETPLYDQHGFLAHEYPSMGLTC